MIHAGACISNEPPAPPDIVAISFSPNGGSFPINDFPIQVTISITGSKVASFQWIQNNGTSYKTVQGNTGVAQVLNNRYLFVYAKDANNNTLATASSKTFVNS